MKTTLFFSLLLIVLVAGMVTPLQASSASTSASPLTIDIQRTTSTGAFGVAHITDAFTVINNGTVATSTLDFGFLRIYRNNFYYVEAEDNLARKLTIDADVNSTSDFFWLRVHFANQLETNRTYKFTVTSVFGNLIHPVSTGLEYNFTAAPVLTQDARVANVTFLATQDSTFVVIPNSTYSSVRVGGFPALANVYKPWKAYSREFFYAPFRSVTQQFLNLQYAERDIIIGQGGSLSVKDTYALYNPSIALSTGITLTLPNGSNNVMAYDIVGALFASPQNPSAPYQVTISPRYSTFRGSETFNFTLTYDLPPSQYLKQTNWWGGYNLTLPLFSDNEDLLIPNVTVRIITPTGISLGTLQLPPQSPVTPPFEVAQDQKTIELHAITDMNNLTFGLTLNYLPFASAVQILPWIFGLELAVFAAVIINRYRRGPAVAVPVPVARLREFVSLYDERIALSRELIAMEEDVNRGSLVKHEFRRRSKVIELRLDEINRSLMEVKSELRTISPRYDELIRRIDNAEADAEGSRASAAQVRSQYRAGKITREAYETVANDINKRIDRTEETVETILITLREEAR